MLESFERERRTAHRMLPRVRFDFEGAIDESHREFVSGLDDLRDLGAVPPHPESLLHLA